MDNKTLRMRKIALAESINSYYYTKPSSWIPSSGDITERAEHFYKFLVGDQPIEGEEVADE